MLTVTCNICTEKDPTNKVEFKSKLLARSDMEAMANLGGEMLAHIQNNHVDVLRDIFMRSQQFNAIGVMKYFDSKSDTYTEQRELIRDQVCEFLIEGAPEDDEEDDVDAEFVEETNEVAEANEETEEDESEE